MPRVRQRCCLTSCEFYCLLLQPPRGARVWLSSDAGIALTLSYLSCIFGTNTPSMALGNRRRRGGLLTEERSSTPVPWLLLFHVFGFLVWCCLFVCFLALVSFCLAIGTGLAPPGPEFMALKMVLVPRLLQNPSSRTERRLPGARLLVSAVVRHLCTAQSRGAPQPPESSEAVGQSLSC